MPVVATGVVVDAIAVAKVEAVLGAVPPDRALYEPWESRRVGRIELARVDAGRQQAENAGAPFGPVASVSVRVAGVETPQDPGPVQEIVDQGVDGHEGSAGFNPQRPSRARSSRFRRFYLHQTHERRVGLARAPRLALVAGLTILARGSPQVRTLRPGRRQGRKVDRVLSRFDRQHGKAGAQRQVRGSQRQPQPELSLQSEVCLQGTEGDGTRHCPTWPEQPGGPGLDRFIGRELRTSRHTAAAEREQNRIAWLHSAYQLGCARPRQAGPQGHSCRVY
jgi:hypothetical protein